MVDGRVYGGLGEDASSVFCERCRNMHSTDYGTHCLDFCFHGFHTTDLAEVGNQPSLSILCSRTGEIEKSASTDCTILHIRASGLGRCLSKVVLATIFRQAKLSGEGNGVICRTFGAASSSTVQQYLWRYLNNSLAFARYLNLVTHYCRNSQSPCRRAMLWGRVGTTHS